jgi:hypothetical protein
MKALTAEPEPEVEEVEAEPEKPAPTAMEIALRRAMDAQEGGTLRSARAAKTKKSSNEIDDLLERTLENRVKS